MDTRKSGAISYVELRYGSSVVPWVGVCLQQILERQMRKDLGVAQSEETGARSELEDRQLREWATGKVSLHTPDHMPDKGLANALLVAEQVRGRRGPEL